MTRLRPTRTSLARGLSAAALGLVMLAPAAISARHGDAGQDRWDLAPTSTAVVGYRSSASLRAALKRAKGRVVRTIPQLRVAEVIPRARPRYFASAISREDGIEYVEPTTRRGNAADPALAPSETSLPGGVLEWQYPATGVSLVSDEILRRAAAVTIALVDTGADLSVPDLAAKAPITHSVVGGGKTVRDPVGHGTFVAALAGGSVTNDDGMAGFGGDARLLIVQASRQRGAFSDFDEAAAIVWAVDHGAQIINLSLGGPDTSSTERKAIEYAARRGVLLVAAVGNEFGQGNPVEYPAALLQPVGSDGRGGVGLAVGASDQDGSRAPFSNTGSHLSLLAPGVNVLSALSTTGENMGYVQVPVPGARSGLYAFASGTSFASPEVAGAAALVWATNPALTAQQVAEILKQSASNRGSWNEETGYGVLDVATAVEQASRGAAAAAVSLRAEPADGVRIRLTWAGQGASGYRVSVREGGGPSRTWLAFTRRTAATFVGRPGHAYAFVVWALDASGTATASSEPAVVSLPASTTRVRLTASPTRGRGPLTVVVRATVSRASGVAPGRRRVLLQIWGDAAGWEDVADADASPSGRAAWRFTLGSGTYRLRARVEDGVRPAGSISPPIAIRVS